ATSSVYISPTGYIGIGTTSPLVRMSVLGDIGVHDQSVLRLYEPQSIGWDYIGFSATSSVGTTITYTWPAAGTAGQALLTADNGNLYWGDPEGSGTIQSGGNIGDVAYYIAGQDLGGTSTMVIHATERIAIGTSTPLSKLSIYGDIFAEGTDRYISFGTTTGTSGYGFRDSGGTLQYRSLGGDWSNVGSSTVGDLGDITNVTISGPNYGDLLMWNNTAWVDTPTSSLQIDIGQTTGTLQVGRGGTGLTSVTDGYILIGTDSSPLEATSSVYISPTGYIGIGTTSPLVRMSVLGDIGVHDQSVLRLYEPQSIGWDYIGFSATSSVGTTITYTWPGAGTAGEALMTASNGNLYWGDPEGSGINEYGYQGYVTYYKNEGTTISGTSTLFITPTERVGIGTTTPDNLLDIYGALGIRNQNGVKLFELASNGVGSITLRASSSIPGSDVVLTFPDNDGGIGEALLTDGNGNLYWDNPEGSGTIGPASYAGMFPYYATAEDDLTATSSIFVDINTSYIGIGTITPMTRLSVVGDLGVHDQNVLRLYEQAAQGLDYIGFGATTTLAGPTTYRWPGAGSPGEALMTASNGNLYWGNPEGSGVIHSSTQGYIAWYQDGADHIWGTSTIFISQSGQVGIGTTTPDNLLDIYGALGIRNQNGVKLFELASNGVGSITLRASSSIPGSDVVLTFPDNDGGIGEALLTDGNGNLYWDNPEGSGTIGPASYAGMFPYYATAEDDLTATSSIFVDINTSYIGIGTITPMTRLSVVGDLGVHDQNVLRLYEQAAQGLDYIGFGATTTLAGPTTYRWPGAGSPGEALMTASNGNLYWGNPEGSGVITGGGVLGQVAYYLSDNTLAGTSTMVIHATERIGIGTSTPLSKLSVYGDIFAEGTDRYINFGTATGTGGYGFRDSDGILQYKVRDGTWANVGSSTVGSLNEVFDVNVDSAVYGDLLMYSGSNWVNVATSSLKIAISSTTGTLFVDRGGTGLTSVDNGYILIGTGGTSLEATSTIYLSDSGLIGIGTTTPDNLLDIYGALGIRNQNGVKLFELASNGTESITFKASSSITGDVVLTFPDNDGGYGEALLTDGNGNLYWANPEGSGTIGSASYAGMFPYYASNEDDLTATSSIFLSTAEYIGIGTTTPMTRLSVVGDLGIHDQSVLRLYEQAASGLDYIGFSATTTLTTPITYTWPGSGTPGEALMLASNGNLYWGDPEGSGVITSGGVLGQVAYYLSDKTLAGTSTLHIDETERVGISTTSPLSKLSVYGDLFMDGSNRYINFGTATGTDGYGFYDQGGTMKWKSTGGDWYAFGTSSVGILNDLQDVTITSYAYGDLLMWNGNQWADTATNSLGLLDKDQIDTLSKLNVIVVDATIASITSDMLGTFDGIDFDSGILAQNALWYGSATASPYELAIGSPGQILWVSSGNTPAWTATNTLGLVSLDAVNGLTDNYIPYWSDGSGVFANSQIYRSGTVLGISTTSPLSKLSVYGDLF
ncbi:beta strand repeat-containing protein, partial [Patescibacteria group bacterium]